MKYSISIIYLLLSTIIVSSQSNLKAAGENDDGVVWPKPFYREMYVNLPKFSGNDVIILQSLLLRDNDVKTNNITITVNGIYDATTAEAVNVFQATKISELYANGVFDSRTAQTLLDLYSDDNYQDHGRVVAADYNKKYKFYIPVYRNRSIETTGILYDAYNKELLEFKVRTHGIRDDGTETTWPDFGDGDDGLNMFSSSGMTVTGLSEMDLNTPEPNATLYGPYPVNRFVKGLEGNALFLISTIRNGLLLHTGNWTTAERGQWDDSMDMPNSNGCMHAHPDAIEQIWDVLVNVCGVTANDNPYNSQNYPYETQGLVSVELID